jgi:hypothetical protein
MRVSSRGDFGEVDSFGMTARLRGLCGESPVAPKGLLGAWKRVAIVKGSSRAPQGVESRPITCIQHLETRSPRGPFGIAGSWLQNGLCKS